MLRGVFLFPKRRGNLNLLINFLQEVISWWIFHLGMAKGNYEGNGFYITIYALDGELMFTSQEYDARLGK